MRQRWARRLTVQLGAVALLVVAAGTARAASHQVTIVDFAFAPATLTVTAGDTVTWTNQDAIVHTVTSQPGAPVAFDSGDMAQGATFSFTFTQPGTYDYLCTPHPDMLGRVVVQAAPVTPAAPAATPSVASVPNAAIIEPGSAPLVAVVMLAALGLGLLLTLRERDARA